MTLFFELNVMSNSNNETFPQWLLPNISVSWCRYQVKKSSFLHCCLHILTVCSEKQGNSSFILSPKLYNNTLLHQNTSSIWLWCHVNSIEAKVLSGLVAGQLEPTGWTDPSGLAAALAWKERLVKSPRMDRCVTETLLLMFLWTKPIN